METNAKGQLGGLDTSEAERRRWAESSGLWKCGTCGKCNKEILEECAEAARAKEDESGSGSGKKVEEEVPEELTMAYRDAMPKAEGSAEQEPKVWVQTDDGEAAELAEGFVQTASIPAASTTASQSYPPARPAQGVPQPTGSASQSTGNDFDSPRDELIRNLQRRNPTTAPQPVQQLEARAAEVRRYTDGVPIWIDRAIAAVVVCLIVMVLRMLTTS